MVNDLTHGLTIYVIFDLKGKDDVIICKENFKKMRAQCMEGGHNFRGWGREGYVGLSGGGHTPSLEYHSKTQGWGMSQRICKKYIIIIYYYIEILIEIIVYLSILSFYH